MSKINNREILCLDLGTKTGFAFYDKGKIDHGTVNFKQDKFAGGGMRFKKFRDWLNTLNKPKEIYYESVRRHSGVDASHVYGGFMSTLTSWAEDNKIPYKGVPVGTIKKSFTGNGNAKKALMIHTCEEKGFKVKDDNNADAIALLYHCLKNE